MALLKQHFLNNFEYYIKVYNCGKQLPELDFFVKNLKPLEKFFNRSESAKDLDWLHDLIFNIQSLKSRSIDVPISKESKTLLKKYSKENNNLLSKFILANSNEDNILISDKDFILELCKYYNAESLFSIFGCLELSFDQLKVIEEDQISITIRYSESLVSEYFTNKAPLFIRTDELLQYFKQWYSFIEQWKLNKIKGLQFYQNV